MPKKSTSRDSWEKRLDNFFGVLWRPIKQSCARLPKVWIAVLCGIALLALLPIDETVLWKSLMKEIHLGFFVLLAIGIVLFVVGRFVNAYQDIKPGGAPVGTAHDAGAFPHMPNLDKLSVPRWIWVVVVFCIVAGLGIYLYNPSTGPSDITSEENVSGLTLEGEGSGVTNAPLTESDVFGWIPTWLSIFMVNNPWLVALILVAGVVIATLVLKRKRPEAKEDQGTKKFSRTRTVQSTSQAYLIPTDVRAGIPVLIAVAGVIVIAYFLHNGFALADQGGSWEAVRDFLVKDGRSVEAIAFLGTPKFSIPPVWVVLMGGVVIYILTTFIEQIGFEKLGKTAWVFVQILATAYLLFVLFLEIGVAQNRVHTPKATQNIEVSEGENAIAVEPQQEGGLDISANNPPIRDCKPFGAEGELYTVNTNLGKQGLCFPDDAKVTVLFSSKQNQLKHPGVTMEFSGPDTAEHRHVTFKPKPTQNFFHQTVKVEKVTVNGVVTPIPFKGSLHPAHGIESEHREVYVRICTELHLVNKTCPTDTQDLSVN